MKKVKKRKCGDGTLEPKVLHHNGYKIIQCTNNHIQIYKDDRIVYHASCNKKMTEDELKEQVDFLKAIREGKDEG